jgi:hypothetical protein
MVEALRSSESSVLTRATRRHIPEYDILYSYCREYLKSYKLIFVFRYYSHHCTVLMDLLAYCRTPNRSRKCIACVQFRLVNFRANITNQWLWAICHAQNTAKIGYLVEVKNVAWEKGRRPHNFWSVLNPSIIAEVQLSSIFKQFPNPWNISDTSSALIYFSH